ncbi:unnamed protein product [Debaryomyces fabryi]|nr:unnamed protein product [Debaryomyces fabryi]
MYFSRVDSDTITIDGLATSALQ